MRDLVLQRQVVMRAGRVVFDLGVGGDGGWMLGKF
jgi:hypothetical protein